MLVYRGMNIGTAKPALTERGSVPYLGLDLADPGQPFSTGAWLEAVTRQVQDFELPVSTVQDNIKPLNAEPVRPISLIVAGGTGLYVKALIAGLNNTAADPLRRAYWNSVFINEGVAGLQRALQARNPQILTALADPANARRLIRALEQLEADAPVNHWPPLPQSMLVGLRLPRPQLHARIAARVARMFRDGLADEVRTLRTCYPNWSATARQAIGYNEVCAWLDGHLSREDAMQQIVIRTRQLAKRQETWFRHQLQVAWIDIDMDESPALIAPRVLDAWRQYGQTPIQWR